MINKTIHLLIPLFLSSPALLAQTVISGTVSGQSGGALIGANIFIQGSYDGASSDIAGHYSFETTLNGEAVLVVSYIGFVEKEQMITLLGKDVDIDFTLKESINKMEAVMISAGTFDAGRGVLPKSGEIKPPISYMN